MIHVLVQYIHLATILLANMNSNIEEESKAFRNPQKAAFSPNENRLLGDRQQSAVPTSTS